MNVDKHFKNTPSRVISNNKLVYPDHYSMILSFKKIPLKSSVNLQCGIQIEKEVGKILKH